MIDTVIAESAFLKITRREGVLKPWSYEFASETRGKGIVHILPFRFSEDAKIEFLVNYEFIPPWAAQEEDMFMVSISGTIEHTENPLEAAMRELAEETGYLIKPGDMGYMGVLFASKGSDTRHHLVVANLTEKVQHEPEKDGSYFEEIMQSKWVSIEEILRQSSDVFLRNLLLESTYDAVLQKIEMTHGPKKS